MAASGGFNLGAMTLGIAGAILAYSGVRGKHISTVLRSLLAGNAPTGGAESGLQIAPSTGSDASNNAPDGADIGSLGTVGSVSGNWATKQYSRNGPETLSFAQYRQLWVANGGPGGSTAIIAAAITQPESGRRPGAVQANQPYATTGWGPWQITPGNSVPSAGIDDALLIPNNNAKAAVAKFKGAGNSFRPWVTFTSGAYAQYLGAAQNG